MMLFLQLYSRALSIRKGNRSSKTMLSKPWIIFRLKVVSYIANNDNFKPESIAIDLDVTNKRNF